MWYLEGAAGVHAVLPHTQRHLPELPYGGRVRDREALFRGSHRFLQDSGERFRGVGVQVFCTLYVPMQEFSRHVQSPTILPNFFNDYLPHFGQLFSNLAVASGYIALLYLYSNSTVQLVSTECVFRLAFSKARSPWRSCWDSTWRWSWGGGGTSTKCCPIRTPSRSS